MECRRRAWLFLGLLVVGLLWPAVAGAIACGGCCKERPGACKVPTTGFSLCCFHSASTLPDLPSSGFVPTSAARLAPADETSGPAPDLQGILHVPKPLLT
jgi:hypothetical protein